MRVCNDILLNMKKQHVTLLVSLDLSAAFKTVDHGVLLGRLEQKFGICGDALAWFKSYLTERLQRILIKDAKSASFGQSLGYLKAPAWDHCCSRSIQASCILSSAATCLRHTVTRMILSYILRFNLMTVLPKTYESNGDMFTGHSQLDD